MSALHKLDLQPRLFVGLATHGGRIQSQVRAFLSGPGRQQFVISDTGRAQVLIADYCNDQSRTELHGFLMLGRGPAIVLAMTDPGLPGTVWVPKPICDDDLSLALQIIWNRLVKRSPPPPVPSASLERPVLRLLPTPSTAPPADLPRLASQRPPGRARMGPFSDTARNDWTASIVWIAMGALFIAAIVSGLGWRPSEQSFRPATSRLTVDVVPDRATEELRNAIQLAVKAMPARTPAMQSWVDAELVDYQRLSGAPPVGAALSRLGLTADVPDVSRRALPVDLMVEAGALWQGQADVRAALFTATRDVSVVAKRD